MKSNTSPTSQEPNPLEVPHAEKEQFVSEVFRYSQAPVNTLLAKVSAQQKLQKTLLFIGGMLAGGIVSLFSVYIILSFIYFSCYLLGLDNHLFLTKTK
jgi:hypothetical protein